MRKIFSLFVIILWILPGLSAYGQDSPNGHSCPDDNHPHMIDLGLPSGTKWACCNVGADTPESYGGYYAWGETYEKDYYDWYHYDYFNSEEYEDPWDNNYLVYYDLGEDIGGTQYDVAHAKWGDHWQMPKFVQFEELEENCTSEKVQIGNVSGMLFTSKQNGSKLFLPAAGRKNWDEIEWGGEQCCYFSSTTGVPTGPFVYGYVKGDFDMVYDECDRSLGYSIRPVYGSSFYLSCPNDNHPHMIDLGLPSGTKWACCNVGADKPEGIGDHYAWGETEPRDEFPYEEGPRWNDTEIQGTEYDVARVKWGRQWQMSNNFSELLNNCSQENTNLNGVDGKLFTGSNGNSIFLPFTGGYEEDGEFNSSISRYWESTGVSFQPGTAYCLNIGTDAGSLGDWWKYSGGSIRPVASAESIVGLQLSTTGLILSVGEEGTINITSGSGSYTVTSNDPNAEFVSVHLDGNMIYIHGVGSGEAVITVTDTQTGETATIEVTVTAPAIVNICPDDNHPHIIDLGLPSGTKWACCNVDTDHPESQSPTNYGGHYSWGETGVKSEYNVYSYAHFDMDEDNFINIGDHIGNTEYDVAHMAWKGSWQMPTDEECEELMDCVQEETTINGVKGLKIIGPNDNFIFLPYAGYRYETELSNQGSSGWYWTETYNEGQWSKALGIPMSFVDVEPREIGHSVRPVIAVNVSTISVTSAGMATYCSPYDLDFRNVTNLKAYIITGYDWQSRRVYATRVYDVPAGLGIYLVGDEGIYDVPRGTSTSYYVANMLVGTLTETIINPTDGDLTNLRLTGSSPKDASFKTFTQPRTFSANRAYLQIPTAILNTSANAVDIVFDDEVDGIDGISQNAENTDNNWFTLDGRKLSGKPSTKGVYVVNGRKVVVK